MEGAEKKLKVYCETSFWSYLTGRPTPLAHIALKQASSLALPKTIAVVSGAGYACPAIVTPDDYIKEDLDA